MEFQKIVRDIEYLTRIHISHKYLQFKKIVEHCENSITQANTFIDDSNLKMIENDKKTVTIDQECQLIQHNIDNESGGALEELEKELTSKLKEEAQSNGAKKSVELELNTEKRNLKSIEKNIADDGNILIVKEKEMTQTAEVFEGLKNADTQDTKAYEDAKKRFEAISSGLATNEDGEASSLQDQLISNVLYI